MSIHSTPHMHHKQTPLDGDNVVLDSTRSVSDAAALSPKQLLNAYIYDFLIKSTLPHTAKSFASEADLPSVAFDGSSAKPLPHLPHLDLAHNTPPTPAMSHISEEHNLPYLAMSNDAPQGFLLEWWQVFWDVFQAKMARQALPAASQYFQMQHAKQKQLNELLGLDGPQSYNLMQQPAGQAPAQAHMAQFGQVPVMMQQPLGPVPVPQMGRQQLAQMDGRQQRYMMQMMMKQYQHQQPLLPAQQTPQPTPQPQHQHQQPAQHQHQRGQHQSPQMPPQKQPLRLLQLPRVPLAANGMDQSMQQQMFIPSQQGQPAQPHQQHQQLQQPHQQPPHQQLQQPPQQLHNRIQQQAQTQMNNFRQQAAAAVAAGQMPRGDKGSPMNMAMANPRVNQAQAVRQAQMAGMQPFPQQGVVNGGMPASGPYGPKPDQHMVVDPNTGVMMAAPPMNQPVQKNRNTNALQDYQMQLMLLEKQNKKRLDIARNGAGDGALQIGQPMHMDQHLSKVSPAPSPTLNTKPLPATAAKTKKPPVKRNARANANGTTPQSSGTDLTDASNNHSNGSLKKEYATPLTPTTDPETTKKKRKGSNIDSPKKLAKTSVSGAKKEKAPPKTKKEAVKSEENGDSHDVSAPPAVEPPHDYFHATVADGDKMISVDILGANGQGEPNFFSSGGNSSIDDIDFDFRLFLDGGDNALNESMNGFNWGNPIEGED